MISSISIDKVTSFTGSVPVEINNLNKKVNLFFGLNGAGKSTIANYLQDQTGLEYHSCSIAPIPQQEQEFLVYNQKFVETHFYQKSSQAGIFTVGEESKDIQEEIEEKQKEVESTKASMTEIYKQSETIKEDIKGLSDSLKESIWREKKAVEDTPLKFCLKNFSTKEKFQAQVINTKGNSSKTLKQLVDEVEGVAEGVDKRSWIEPISFDREDIEKEEILSQRIVGSSDSYLSEFVDELKNSDWVKLGIPYLEDSDKCPFCQRELQHGFVSELSKLFDQRYEDNLRQLRLLRSQYSVAINSVKLSFENELYQQDYVKKYSELEPLQDSYLAVLEANLNKLDQKLEKPSDPILLVDSSEHIANINLILNELKTEVENFNHKIEQKDSFLASIKSEFWKIINKNCAAAIQLKEANQKKQEDKLKELREEYRGLLGNKKSADTELAELQEKAASIESSITQINNQLKSLGIDNFHIESIPEQQGLYRLARSGSSESNVYDSLSEGEKTLITFLYFVEYCFGTGTKDSLIDLNNRIVVIDDPISSLSHNYVYDIASIIHHKVIAADFLQVFVLTHNLYFFHELLMLRSPVPGNNIPDYNLFRVFKAGTSNIIPMQRNDLQNDYQSYWQIVKDCKNGLAQPNLLPNAMRNILEHYFNFIHKKDRLKAVLEKLGEEEVEFKPLFRYISREGHSDSINLFDTGAINTEKYLDKFELVFNRTNHIDHYNNMIREE